MKKYMGLLIAVFCVLLALCAQAEETSACTLVYGKETVEWPMLTDGDPSTVWTGKKGKSVQLTLEIPQGTQVTAFYLEADPQPASLTIKTKNDRGKWEETFTAELSCAQALVTLDQPLSGQAQLVLRYNTTVTPTLAELRVYAPGEPWTDARQWEHPDGVDVLYVQAGTELPLDRLRAWTAEGKQVAVATLQAPESGTLLPWLDALWDAGVHAEPLFGDFRALKESEAADPEKVKKAWSEKKLTAWAVSRLRETKPLCLALDASDIPAAQVAREIWSAAVPLAAQSDYELEDAGIHGLWLTPAQTQGDTLPKLITRAQAEEHLRAAFAEEFDRAAHSDPAEIPYPQGRDSEGYLPGDEFIYENEERGLWAYLSETLQVQIVRYEDTDPVRVWFEAEVRFKPERETFGSVTYGAAAFAGQQTYPETLAQSEQLVFAINGDYYPYRADRGHTVGNIIRQGQVLYSATGKRNRAYPVLDNLVLRDDGSMEVYAYGEVTAEEIAASGTAHDMFSFGPVLVRDGELMVYTGSHCDADEPRMSIGMIAPGHYRIIMVEGRISGGPAGIDLNTLARLQYCRGVEQAFNLDGGNTAVMLFMGRKLNRTGAIAGTGLGSPRNMHELVGVGHSEQVHTDMLEGKKK